MLLENMYIENKFPLQFRFHDMFWLFNYYTENNFRIVPDNCDNCMTSQNYPMTTITTQQLHQAIVTSFMQKYIALTKLFLYKLVITQCFISTSPHLGRVLLGSTVFGCFGWLGFFVFYWGKTVFGWFG